MTDNSFYSVMHDLTGKQRLEGEDPRWSQLFNCTMALTLNGNEDMWKQFCTRLAEYNLVTGNFVALLEKTARKLRQITTAKIPPSQNLYQQCCVSLHVITLITQYFCSHLGVKEVSICII
jgi:hypothetical protein